MDDNDVVALAQHGDNDAVEYIIKKYQGLLRRLAMYVRNGSMDIEDLVQEGRIALYKAIMAYSGKAGCSFKSFFCVCVRRQLHNALKTVFSKKNKPLNQYVQLKSGREDMGIEIEDKRELPCDIVARKELVELAYNAIGKELSSREANIMQLRLRGYKYKEIATMLKLDKNKVGKAIATSRNKLRRALKWRI